MAGAVKRWGVWDTKEHSWYEGDLPNAAYAAGVPVFRTEKAAQQGVAAAERTAK